MPAVDEPSGRTPPPAPLLLTLEEPTPMAMLNRQDIPGNPAAAVGGDLNALLGKGSEFEGKLTFEGTVRHRRQVHGHHRHR